jgi:hypothetical protein
MTHTQRATPENTNLEENGDRAESLQAAGQPQPVIGWPQHITANLKILAFCKLQVQGAGKKGVLKI